MPRRRRGRKGRRGGRRGGGYGGARGIVSVEAAQSTTLPHQIVRVPFRTLLSGTVPAAGTGLFNFGLDPSVLGGRVNQTSAFWEMYRFTKLRFTIGPTSQFNVALSYYPVPFDTATVPNSFATVIETGAANVVHGIGQTTPTTLTLSGRELLHSGQAVKWWRVITSSETNDQNFQGHIIAQVDTPPVANTTIGVLVDGEVEYMSPVLTGEGVLRRLLKRSDISLDDVKQLVDVSANNSSEPVEEKSDEKSPHSDGGFVNLEPPVSQRATHYISALQNALRLVESQQQVPK